METKPVGFWKFIIVSSVAMTLLRLKMSASSAPNFESLKTSFFLSIFLWAFYRFARTQAWWPFALFEKESISTELVAPAPNEYRQVVVSPRKVPPKLPLFNPAILNRSIEPKAALTQNMTPNQLASSLRSNVGVRSKSIRSKKVRTKTIRFKRKPPLVLG